MRKQQKFSLQTQKKKKPRIREKQFQSQATFVLLKLVRKMGKKGTDQNSFHESSIMLIQKLDKDPRKKIIAQSLQ